jgi:hypothetical protein
MGKRTIEVKTVMQGWLWGPSFWSRMWRKQVEEVTNGEEQDDELDWEEDDGAETKTRQL